MLNYKWESWRFLSEYPETPLKRLKHLQTLYAHIIKNNHNVTEALANSFLETDAEGLPLKRVTLETMDPFERYTECNLLVSYANMLQTKILQYLLVRLEAGKIASYNNDPQSLLCLQMLHDFRERFTKTAITDALLEEVMNWKKFITTLKVATLPGTSQALFPHHEEANLATTLQWLLTNIGNLLDQISEEIQLELNRRSLASHLDNLAHSTKVTIELGFEYIAHMLTYIPLPLDFGLANFYEKNIDLKFHETLYQKTWFQNLYQLASSSAIKQLFFGTKEVHYALKDLMTGNPTMVITDPIEKKDQEKTILWNFSQFLTKSGEVNEEIIKQLNQKPKTIDKAEETGLLALFCEPQQAPLLENAIKFLGYLEIIARLTNLIRVASYLLHQDGSLLARKETQLQMQLFMDIYQNLFIELFSIILTFQKTLDQQLDDKQRFLNESYRCNPNLALSNALKDNLWVLQKDCKHSLASINHHLTHIEAHQRELNELLCWFKQQWFGFMGSYSWLLSDGQQQTVLQLQQGEIALAKQTTPMALLAVSQTKRPKLIIDTDNAIDIKALYGLLQFKAAQYPNCCGVQLTERMAFSEPDFMQRSLAQLTKGQCYVYCVTNEEHLTLFMVRKNQKGVLEAVYMDMLKNLETGALSIQLTKLIEAYALKQDQALHLYESAVILLGAKEGFFNANYLWEEINQRGLNSPLIMQLYRYTFAQYLIAWQASQMNKMYESIVITENVEKITKKLEIHNQTNIVQSTIEDLFSSFPALTLHINIQCTALSTSSISALAKTYGERFNLQCYDLGHQKLVEIPLGRRWHQPRILIDRCLRQGISEERIWDSLMIAAKEEEEQVLNTVYRDNGESFLHLAVTLKRASICNYLLVHGIDKTIVNNLKKTALDLAVELVDTDQDVSELKKIIKILLNHRVPSSPEHLQKAKEYVSQEEEQRTSGFRMF